MADGNDGCLIECAIDEAVKHNWETDWSWECISVEESSRDCTGDFQRDCDADPEEFDPQCACPEERWMNADCSEARLCTEEESVTCPEGQIVYSNSLIDGTALEEGIKCVDEDEEDCPETSYHIGCNGMTYCIFRNIIFREYSHHLKLIMSITNIQQHQQSNSNFFAC